MSSYDPKERRKLATHAEGVPRFRQSDFELPSCLVLGCFGDEIWAPSMETQSSSTIPKKRGATLTLSQPGKDAS